ncbi:MAG: hypothetical protein JXB03_12095 [Spirochaetales bacterium]|nr:hypothetical protein [Spirochaetales bacterium]
MANEDLFPAEEKISGQRSPAKPEATNIFSRLINFIINQSDPERQKKKLLKDIARQLKRSKYKFIKTKTDEVLPGLALFFYDIYKTIGPAQVLLDHADSSSVLKTIIIERFLSKEQLEIRDYLQEDNIKTLATTRDPKSLAKECKDRLITLFSAFDNETVNKINGNYNGLKAFLKFIHYDYYFLLRKFDSGLPERDFIYKPRFDTISGGYITDDLKDWLEVGYAIDKNLDWNELFDVLQIYRDVNVVDQGQWRKILRQVEDCKKSTILELVVRYIDKNPYFKTEVNSPGEKIVEEYLNKLKTQTEMTIQKVLRERQNKKIDGLLKEIFGTVAVSRMKNYTEKNNMVFSKKMLGGFIYVAPLNYLKAFLLDYFKKDIREVVDVLLIRGKWSTNIMSQQLSESFHALMQVSEDLLQFDDSLSDEGQLGIALRNASKKADRDNTAMTVLRTQLKKVNDRALSMIQEAAQNLISVGKNLKITIEDYDRKPHELIINWKEIDISSDHQIRSKIAVVYKKIYYFIQLLQYFLKKNDGTEGQ